MSWRVFIGPAGIVLLTAISAGAQTAPPPLTSNRPGIGESEALVGRGVVQVEAGFQTQGATPGDHVRWQQTWGQLSIRLGLAPRIEIFGGWDGLSVERVRDGNQSHIVAGGNDLRVGAKLALLSEDHHDVTLTVSPAWLFPVGIDEFSTGSNDGSLRLLIARSLPRNWSVSGNLLFTRTSSSSGRYWDNAATLDLARTLTPSVSAFVEVAPDMLGGAPDRWTMDAGVAWVARPDLQWDISAGHTFNQRGEPWFVSAGISLRYR